MRSSSLKTTILAAVVLLAASQAGHAAEHCAALRKACRAEGFVARGQDDGGAGRLSRCVNALVNNKEVEENSLMPLPDVAPEAIAACRVERAAADRARMDQQTPESAAVPVLPLVPAPPGEPANIIFVLADDFSWNLMPETGGEVADSMPNLAALQADGVTFDNYFVTNSLCAAGGYRTGMVGKYINGYRPEKYGAGPGWSDWSVGGRGYPQYARLLNNDGTMSFEEGYLTDIMAERAAAMLDAAAAAGRPALIYIAPFAPHSPYVPPDRYKALYPDLVYPRGPAYRVAPDEAAPAWLKAVPPLPANADGTLEAVFRDRVRTGKAIDDLIGALRRKLEADGLADTTYFVFSSDNGYHLGDYGLFAGKMTPFDTDTRVPLVIAGPGVAKGLRISQIAMNVDLFPTFADLAGLPVPANVDGASLVPLLNATPAPDWRNLAVIEHEKTTRQTAGVDQPDFGKANPDTYVALRLPSALYVEYSETGERSYYDLAADPAALHNVYDSLPEARRQSLADAVAANHSCAGEGACWIAQQLTP